MNLDENYSPFALDLNIEQKETYNNNRISKKNYTKQR